MDRVFLRMQLAGPRALWRWGLLAFYALLSLAPTINVLIRQSRNLANAHSFLYCLGWTILGWVAALLWALKGATEDSSSRQS